MYRTIIPDTGRKVQVMEGHNGAFATVSSILTACICKFAYFAHSPIANCFLWCTILSIVIINR